MLWPALVAVVANVMVEVGETSFSESAVRNTSAKAGAGTGMVQVLAFWSHWIVVTFSVPFIRPSDFRASPNVCPAHVKLPLDDTDGANRYLTCTCEGVALLWPVEPPPIETTAL